MSFGMPTRERFNIGFILEVTDNRRGHNFNYGEIVRVVQTSGRGEYICESINSIKKDILLDDELSVPSPSASMNAQAIMARSGMSIPPVAMMSVGQIPPMVDMNNQYDNLINNNEHTMKKGIKNFSYGLNAAIRKGEVKSGDRVRVKNAGCWRSYPDFITITHCEVGRVEWRGSGCACGDLDKPFDMEFEINDSPVNIPATGLDKVVLPKESKEEIIAVLKQHQFQDKIFKEWGLGDTIEYGKGMTFLFYGKPGTGKTWCATQMAKLMNREMLIVTPAEIQSQEPGGANRAIQAAFKNAKEQNKLVLLDECDGLITERNDVGMILGSEINTLLTEIEKFEGICVLTTNRIDTLDEALERRISLIVEFEEPNFDTREKLWNKLLPVKMPLGKDVKIPKLSEFKLTGGQIKNVILQAARLAVANEETKVDFKYFETAISRINSSKNLMGSSSRYRQINVKQDMMKSVKRAADKIRG